jgi:DNA repair protein RecN (Recombination protein N)
MLKSLSIRNYALIESIEVEFGTGLNILTGETGAGKSIIIDALGLLLGERASTEIIRKGTDKAIVEGVFGIVGNKRVLLLLERHAVDAGEALIIRREVSAKGQGRCFLNDTPVPLATLKEIGDLLVDLHGQHEHQSLLRTETHIELVDEFGGLDGMVTEYRESYDRLAGLTNSLRELSRKERDLKEKRDLYEFQIREIDAVDPQPDEEAQLETELRILENAEKLYEATARLTQMLYEGEHPAYDILVKARNQIEDLAAIDQAFEESKSECASAVAVIGELTKFIQAYNSKIEFNPERLERIRERLGHLSLLKKKYGGSLESVLKRRGEIGRAFEIAENFEGEMGKLAEQIATERASCSERAERLSSKRRELVGKLGRAVGQELAKLGIPHGRFDVAIVNRPMPKAMNDGQSVHVRLGNEAYEATPQGIDFVEFHLSTNAGEDPKPLVKVASGGEVSRVMLAMKSVLAKADRLPSLVFDEIDTGISGRIAAAVGKSLDTLSEFHQIIAITHLPQIAGFADCHFVAEKHEHKGRTTSRLRKLNEDQRVREIARLMSGDEVTDAGLKGARELMRSK